MREAVVHSQPRSPYNGHRFAAGLRRLGYKTPERRARILDASDVAVFWNRHECHEKIIAEYERVGAPVLIVENGYFGRTWLGRNWHALALGQHNGLGTWPQGDDARWDSLSVEIKPWKTDGREIVILAQRGIGSVRARQPAGWVKATADRIEKSAKRAVRIREHPGPQNAAPKRTLEQDLANAWCAVTWGSSAAIKAIALGIPVFHALPQWIGSPAARPLEQDIEDRFLGDPLPMFRRLAWAMAPIEEIESGEALKGLLKC